MQSKKLDMPPKQRNDKKTRKQSETIEPFNAQFSHQSDIRMESWQTNGTTCSKTSHKPPLICHKTEDHRDILRKKDCPKENLSEASKNMLDNIINTLSKFTATQDAIGKAGQGYWNRNSQKKQQMLWKQRLKQ